MPELAQALSWGRRDGGNELLTGLVVEGRYRLGELIGKGACGVVYEGFSLAPALATHRRRRVAIKLLASDQANDPGATARFMHEAFLASRFSHPNLVKVLD